MAALKIIGMDPGVSGAIAILSADGSVSEERGRQMTRVLGIDPGVVGGWAIVDATGLLLAAGDLPVSGEGTKRMVSAPLFRAVIDEWSPDEAVIELVHAMPKQGVSSSFKFGRAAGVVEGVIGGLLIPTRWVTSKSWKGEFRLSAEKEPSRQLAIQMWPGMAKTFARKMDHGRAEAALIARYHVQQSRAHAMADTEF
jgi:hypothetical protein